MIRRPQPPDVEPQLEADSFLRRLADNRHIEQLLSHVPDVNYFAKDEHGRFVQADDGFVKMLGASCRADVIGRTDYDFFPADVAARFVADDRAVMTTGEPLIQHIEPVPRPDRTFVWRTVTKVALYDSLGLISGIAGVTCRVHAENATCHPGIFAAMQHIGKHYGETLTVRDLAQLANLSPRAFERHFARTFSTSPLRYLNSVRLRAARHLLLTSQDSLAEIATACGFCDQSHMTAQFTQRSGTTPRRYRSALGHGSGTPLR